jgi:hypothetical protein
MSKNLKSINVLVRYNVADPGCLSRIPDPDFYSSRIPDPTIATKEGEKICCPSFFVASKKYGFGIRDPKKPVPDPGSATLIKYKINLT